MARGSKNPTMLNKEQEEMTVVVMRFKGAGETLRKGFDTVSQAIAALGTMTVPQRRLASRGTQEPPEVENNGNSALGDSGDEEELEETNNASVSAPQREVSDGRRRYSVPKFLSDFNLDGDGMKWKDYAAKKNPETDNEKYLVASLWLTKHAGQETFTANHVFTCFRAMEWTPQKDFSQPLRYMKKQKSYFDAPSRGNWKLTRPGTDAAESVASKDETSIR
jgi:hypothetical protein